MTEIWLEFVGKMLTMTNLRFVTLPKFTTTTNINFTPKNMLVLWTWTEPPALVCKLALAGTPAQPRFAPLQEQKPQARRLGGPWT